MPGLPVARANQLMGCYSSRPSPGPPLPQLSTASPEQADAVHATHGLPPRVKLVLIGDSGVGKSCLALRYVKGMFDPQCRITVGAAFLSHSTTLPDGNTVKFELWDTAGQERYQSLAPLYYRGSHAAAVVYDVTMRESFVKAQFWIDELQRNAGQSIVLVLVGNKTDLAEQRQVSEEEGRDLADSCGMMFVETSAKTAANVAEVFESVAAKLAGGLPVSSNATVVM